MAKKFKDVLNLEEVKEGTPRSAAAVLLDAQNVQENQMTGRLAIRLDKSLLNDFRTVTKKLSVNSSNVLRAFITEYVNAHQDLLDK